MQKTLNRFDIEKIDLIVLLNLIDSICGKEIFVHP